ncbi:MAG: hypothetical protein KH222_08435 [Butyricicoccus pullicaecorum]|nr:hypothetical protein [Butyricicoccus pullicaecorum]
MELKILDYLCDHNGFAEYGAILNTFPDILETSGFLQLLRDDGYISGSLDSYSVVSVTKKGRAYRSKLADDMNDRAKERAYVRSENHCTKVIAGGACVLLPPLMRYASPASKCLPPAPRHTALYRSAVL